MRHNRLVMAGAMIAIASTALAGCSSGSAGSSSSASPKTITMWIYPVITDKVAHSTYWDSTIKAFEAEHKNVKVNYEIFPWANRDEALATAIAAGKGPDVVYLIPDQLPVYAKSIEPIENYLSATQKNDILPNVVSSITINGHLMGAPILTSAQPLVCNATAFKAAGISEYPKTWADLMKLAPTFKQHNIYALSYYASPDQTLNMSFYPLLWQAGGTVFNKDGTKVAFNSKAGVEALQYMTDMAKNGYIEKDSITTFPPLEQTATARNKVACTWMNVLMELEPFWGKAAIKVLPPLTNQTSVAYGTVGSLSMLKGSANKKAAGDFAAFATNAQNGRAFDTASGFFSPLKSTGKLYAADPILGAVEATIPLTYVGQLFPESRAVMGALSPEIQAALLGTKSPQQALDDAAVSAQYLLK